MSSYELFSSVSHPVMGAYLDGAIFCTLYIDLDRHLSNIDVHNLVHPFEYKKSIGPLGIMLLMLINIG